MAEKKWRRVFRIGRSGGRLGWPPMYVEAEGPRDRIEFTCLSITRGSSEYDNIAFDIAQAKRLLVVLPKAIAAAERFERASR